MVAGAPTVALGPAFDPAGCSAATATPVIANTAVNPTASPTARRMNQFPRSHTPDTPAIRAFRAV
jgi:hypothetical protein